MVQTVLAMALTAWVGATVLHAESAEPTTASYEMGYRTPVAEYARAEFDSALRMGLDRAGIRIVAPDSASHSHYRVCVDIEATRRGYAFDVRIEDPRGKVAASSQRSCELCGVVESTEMLADLAAAVVHTAVERAPRPGVVEISTTPADSNIRIDGVRHGRGEVPLPPGVHTLDVDAMGYHAEHREFEVNSGVRESLDVVLVPRAARSPRAWLVAAAVTGGVGLGSVAAGTGLWVADGRPYEPSCQREGVDVNGRCAQMYTTRSVGITMTSLGVALTGTGVGLLIAGLIARRRLRRATQTRAVSVRAHRHRHRHHLYEVDIHGQPGPRLR